MIVKFKVLINHQAAGTLVYPTDEIEYIAPRDSETMYISLKDGSVHVAEGDILFE